MSAWTLAFVPNVDEMQSAAIYLDIMLVNASLGMKEIRILPPAVVVRRFSPIILQAHGISDD